MYCLVVEDDKSFRTILVRTLESAGHKTCHAGDGAGALELLRTEDVDVVLLDLQLPKVSGFEVAGRMRLDPWLRQIPIVVMTGAAAEDIEARIANPLEGVVTILGKPVNMQHLLAILARLGEK
jgi:CheY-like chemotaxis protein